MTGARATSQVSPELHSLSGLSCKPFIMSLCLVMVALATTSGVAYFATLLLHLVQLIKLGISCRKLQSRTGVNQYTTRFHSHVTITFLLLFCNLATFPLTLHWNSIGRPLFFYSFPSNSLLHLSLVTSYNETATSGYYASFTDGHIISCLLTLLCLSFVWQQKPLSFLLELPHARPKLHPSGYSHSLSTPSTSTSTTDASCKTTMHCTTPSSPLPPQTPQILANTRSNKSHIASKILLSTLNVTALFAAISCHNVFLLPHFSALAILLFTLNGMNSLLSDSLDLQRITAHHHEHGE